MAGQVYLQGNTQRNLKTVTILERNIVLYVHLFILFILKGLPSSGIAVME